MWIRSVLVRPHACTGKCYLDVDHGYLVEGIDSQEFFYHHS